MTLVTVPEVARSFKRDCSDPRTQDFQMALIRIAHRGKDLETVESLEDLVATARKNLEEQKHAQES